MPWPPGHGLHRRFAGMTTEPQNGVTEMAKDEQKNGRKVVAKKLADAVKNQSAEVKQMQGSLDQPSSRWSCRS